MSYLQFHLLFILPPLVPLIAAHYWQIRHKPGRDSGSPVIWGVAAIALVYTTPWDNYLVWREVWSYGAERVLGTVGYVPIEEYAFFVLQPLLTGYWLELMLRTERGSGVRIDAPRLGGLRLERTTASYVGGAVWLLLTALGLWSLTGTETLYLGCILAWAGPVGVLQWTLKGSTFWQLRRPLLIGTAVPTFYLWIADRIAIALNIWSISPEYTVGWSLFGLPLEEAVFFAVTNLMVTQGILMFCDAA